MRLAMVAGIVLIILGALALAFRNVSFTKKDKEINIGPLQAKIAQKERVELPLWLGGGLVAGGLVLVVAGGSRRR